MNLPDSKSIKPPLPRHTLPLVLAAAALLVGVVGFTAHLFRPSYESLQRSFAPLQVSAVVPEPPAAVLVPAFPAGEPVAIPQPESTAAAPEPVTFVRVAAAPSAPDLERVPAAAAVFDAPPPSPANEPTASAAGVGALAPVPSPGLAPTVEVADVIPGANWIATPGASPTPRPTATVSAFAPSPTTAGATPSSTLRTVKAPDGPLPAPTKASTSAKSLAVDKAPPPPKVSGPTVLSPGNGPTHKR